MGWFARRRGADWVVHPRYMNQKISVRTRAKLVQCLLLRFWRVWSAGRPGKVISAFSDIGDGAAHGLRGQHLQRSGRISNMKEASHLGVDVGIAYPSVAAAATLCSSAHPESPRSFLHQWKRHHQRGGHSAYRVATEQLALLPLPLPCGDKPLVASSSCKYRGARRT